MFKNAIEPFLETVGKMVCVATLDDSDNEWVIGIRNSLALFGLLMLVTLTINRVLM